MKIAIVGATGAVGQELIKLLEKHRDSLVLMDSKSEICFDGIDLAFFCVSNALANKWIPIARKAGAICIDSSSAFRQNSDVPLIIPEINAHTLEKHNGIIASPNCTTTLMLMALTPLHRLFQIKRIVAATYQAVSGAGIKGMHALQTQSKAYLEGTSVSQEVFPHPCAFNIFPHESTRNVFDYAEEEWKMHEETRKILDDETIQVTATCARVPVFRVHAIALNVEFTKPFELSTVHTLIKKTPGVLWKQTASSLDAAEQEKILCTQVRLDHSQPNTLEMWVFGDQLLKGAALNMVQIAETLALFEERAHV